MTSDEANAIAWEKASADAEYVRLKRAWTFYVGKALSAAEITHASTLYRLASARHWKVWDATMEGLGA